MADRHEQQHEHGEDPRVARRLREIERRRLRQERKERRAADRDAARTRRQVVSALRARENELKREIRKSKGSPLLVSLEAQLTAVRVQLAELADPARATTPPPVTVAPDSFWDEDRTESVTRDVELEPFEIEWLDLPPPALTRDEPIADHLGPPRSEPVVLDPAVDDAAVVEPADPAPVAVDSVVEEPYTVSPTIVPAAGSAEEKTPDTSPDPFTTLEEPADSTVADVHAVEDVHVVADSTVVEEGPIDEVVADERSARLERRRHAIAERVNRREERRAARAATSDATVEEISSPAVSSSPEHESTADNQLEFGVEPAIAVPGSESETTPEDLPGEVQESRRSRRRAARVLRRDARRTRRLEVKNEKAATAEARRIARETLTEEKRARRVEREEQRRAGIEARRIARELLVEERRSRRNAGPDAEHGTTVASPEVVTPDRPGSIAAPSAVELEAPIVASPPASEATPVLESAPVVDSPVVDSQVVETAVAAENTREQDVTHETGPAPVAEGSLPPVTLAPENLSREELLEREAAARAERLAAEMDLAAARRQVELERRRTETERERAETAVADATAVTEQLSTLQARKQLLEAKAASKAEMKKAKAESRRLAIESRVRSGAASEEEVQDLQSRIAAADARLLSLAEESGLRIRQLEEELQQARELERGEPRRDRRIAEEVSDGPTVEEPVIAEPLVTEPASGETVIDEVLTAADDSIDAVEDVLGAEQATGLEYPADPSDVMEQLDVAAGDDEAPTARGFLDGLREARAMRAAQRDAERLAATEERRLEQLRREENREDLRRERTARAEAREQARAEKLRAREEAIRSRVEENLAASLSSTFDVTETDDQRTIPIIDEANEILESTPASIMGDDHVDLGNSDLASVTDPSVDAAVALSRRELRRRRRENLKAERAAARTEAIKLRVAEQAPVDSAEHLPTPEHDIAEATATAATPTETFAAVDPIAADDPRSVYEPVATDEPFAADDTFVTDHTVAGDGTEVAASPVSELADPARTLVNSDPVTTDSVAPQTVVSGPATIDHDPVPAADDTDDVLEIRDFAATRNTTENEAPPADSAPLPAAPLPRLDATQLRGSLLENVPEEFRTQIESWLRDIGPETLERITAEDIDRAVRILEDETDDENLEHLRDVIRERPPVRITFAEPTAPQETAAPAFDTTSAEPELRRESSLLSVFSRTGREERREQRTRAKIAREQVRLERTRVKSERRQSLREERQRRREERDESKIQRSLARVQGLSLRERIAQSRMQRQTSRALRSEFREREQLRIRELRAAERTLKSEAKQGKRAAAKTEKSQRSLERREEREIKRTQRDLQRDEKKLDRSDRSEFKESSRSRSREERRVEKARSRSLRSDEKEARRLEKARTDEETAARKAVVDGEAAKLRSEAAQTRQQVRSIRRLERESGRLSRIQEKARKRAEKSDVKAQRSAERARKRELAKQEMEAKAALTRERMLTKESEKITKRAARVEKLSRGGLSSSSTILPAPGGRYDWNTEAGFLGGAAVGEDIDPAAFDLPEGLPSRTR